MGIGLLFILLPDEGDAAGLAATVFLGDTVYGETLHLLEDVKPTSEVNLPTIIQTDESVVVSIEVIGKIYSAGSKVIGDSIEDINHVRAMLVIVRCREVYLQAFWISHALLDGVDEFNEVVNLVRLADKGIGELHLVYIP